MRKTKIVCTLGPASNSEKTMRKMLRAGMNVARLNFSHGTHEEHKKTIERFRSVRDQMHISAAVMLDTKGPEIRIKTLKDGSAAIHAGDTYTFTSRDVEGNEKEVSITYAQLPGQLTPDTRILLDDGRLAFTVLETTQTDIICRVDTDGTIKNRKSINIPNFPIDMPYLSEADKADVIFGIENDVDFIAASFVRSKDDVIALRKFMDYNGGHKIKIISKIEKDRKSVV